ncbi:MAG: NlpC/P60 family protein [Polyangiales bacterium]
MSWAKRVIAAGSLYTLLSCGTGSDLRGGRDLAAADGGRCPARAPAPAALPNTPPEVATLAYWQRDARDDDEVLLDAASLRVHDQALHALDGAPRSVDLHRAPSESELRGWLDERLKSYQQLFAAGELAREPAAEAAVAQAAQQLQPAPALHVALAPVELRCIPSDVALRASKGDPSIDRNRCSQARAQEPVEVLGRVGPGFRLARTPNAFGFIADGAPLSPAAPSALVADLRRGPSLALSRALTLAGQALPADTLLRTDAKGAVIVATEAGFERAPAPAASDARPTHRPLTRGAFLAEAFRYLGTPYGWGDRDGGRDCSRLVLDVLAGFGLGLPRTSAHQRASGRYTLEVPAAASETDRQALLDEASERGVVLLHFPGHILFYLGRDRAGVPRALHALAEYATPCPGGGETVVDVGKVVVSDLSLGKGTSRRSLLERATHLTVLGKPPGYALLALARFRAPVAPRELAPKRCGDRGDVAIFSSPRTPDASRPLRAIAVSKRDHRPAALWLVSPSGKLEAPPQHDLGVGPYTRWVERAHPEPGTWRVLLADGSQTLACQEVKVAKAATAPGTRSGEAPAWSAQLAWDADTERLYAAFVEQLLSHPIEDLKSWSNLSELLRDPARNLLFDHRGLGEDTQLSLAPDCADLPYLLRAYFAWKLGLPISFRPCTRGKAGVPPRCTDALTTHQTPLRAKDDRAGLERFWRLLRDGVHSASGRTVPDDPNSDLYPLPLTREALTPGSVFIDPYGHMIVVGKWVPQGLAGQAMLLGADAQPDATVGRRRFWRGNFLFTPDTRDVGAGFKAFRPVVGEGDAVHVLDDEAIRAHRDFPAPSRAQYEGDLDAFYARMDELIYPRPVTIDDRMARAVDALDEQVRRRVEAIDTGEQGLKGRSEPIDMPEGYAIFETQGPWEDFATPSRDMRLLIAIDAVRALPAQARKSPKRFGTEAGAPELLRIDDTLKERLAARKFAYTRSDGSSFSLSLAEVVARVAILEVAYNPNDCVESRWGAPEGSEERKPCRKQAPAAQRAKLEQYRPWFHERVRPARP